MMPVVQGEEPGYKHLWGHQVSDGEQCWWLLSHNNTPHFLYEESSEIINKFFPTYCSANGLQC